MSYRVEAGKGVTSGQRVRGEKLQRAREFRSEPTPQERILWGHLRAGRLGGFHFRRQQVIDGLIVDFFCAAAGLIVEVDGPVHAEAGDYDQDRDAVLAQRGLEVLRVSNEDVERKISEVLNRVRRKCETRSRPPGNE